MCPGDTSAIEKQLEAQLDIGQQCYKEQKPVVMQLVKQWQGIFVLTDDELRQTDVVGLSIKMDDSTFLRILPHTLRDELKEEL